ncbi:hypothetical protein [Alteromonas hispanica]|uniref:Uncharacterized protein n=1 Tax=Alteromonas hispanica TaxID=315421 RepID=A0A6L9MQU3_9ALTE|nr:hypothetical protein [Alteromonas hispanica]NDW20536.1 hypothetical protein [Alteromonas hispanica]
MNRTIITITLFLCPLAVHAADTEGKEKEVEVIEVVGRKPVNFYKKQYQKTVFDFYDVFNSITSDDLFKVRCKSRPRKSFTRIKTRQCHPNYLSKIKSSTLQQNLALSRGGSLDGLQLASGSKQQEQYRKMLEKHGEVLEQAILNSEVLQKKYRALMESLETYEKMASESDEKVDLDTY